MTSVFCKNQKDKAFLPQINANVRKFFMLFSSSVQGKQAAEIFMTNILLRTHNHPDNTFAFICVCLRLFADNMLLLLENIHRDSSVPVAVYSL